MPRDSRLPLQSAYFGFDSTDSMIDPYSGPTSLINQLGAPDDSMYPGEDEQANAKNAAARRYALGLAAALRRRKK